ncbi:MAG: IclR family transcriptional regulator [Desulfobacterales bacterium]
MPSSSNQYFSTTLEKGLSILRLFDRDHTRLTLSQITHECGLNKTSAYRLVNTLVCLGYLNKNPQSKILRLGLNALALGHNFLQGFELLQTVKPLIDETFSQWKMTIDTALVSDLSLLALYRREAPGTIFFRHPLVSTDLHARAMGKAVLARLAAGDRERALEKIVLKAHTPNTITDRSSLEAELEATRARGYAVNNEEFFPGLVAIGAPLMNFQSGEVIGAISFDFALGEHTLDSVVRQYAAVLTRLANDLSEIVTITEH